MRQIQGKLVLLRVSREFELPRVRVIGVQLYRRNIFTGIIVMFENVQGYCKLGLIVFKINFTLFFAL